MAMEDSVTDETRKWQPSTVIKLVVMIVGERIAINGVPSYTVIVAC